MTAALKRVNISLEMVVARIYDASASIQVMQMHQFGLPASPAGRNSSDPRPASGAT
jgi:hypothetical protein